MANELIETGGSFFGGLISSPFRAVKGFIQGAWGSVWNGVLLTGIIAGTKIFAPELWRAILKATGGQEAVDKAIKEVNERGIPGVLVDSGKIGFGIAGAVGGAKGAWQSAASGQEGAAKAGGVVGSVAIMGAAIVTIGALLNSKDTKPAGSADHGAKQPGATPPTGNSPGDSHRKV